MFKNDTMTQYVSDRAPRFAPRTPRTPRARHLSLV